MSLFLIRVNKMKILMILMCAFLLCCSGCGRFGRPSASQPCADCMDQCKSNFGGEDEFINSNCECLKNCNRFCNGINMSEKYSCD